MDDVLKTLGKRIRKGREKEGMTQAQLAQKIGKKQKHISDYENGKKAIAVGNLPAIAKALKVSISWLFYEELETPRHEYYDRIMDLIEDASYIYEDRTMQLADFFSRHQKKMLASNPSPTPKQLENWSYEAIKQQAKWFEYVNNYYDGRSWQNNKILAKPPKEIFDLNTFWDLFSELNAAYQQKLIEKLEFWAEIVKADINAIQTIPSLDELFGIPPEYLESTQAATFYDNKSPLDDDFEI